MRFLPILFDIRKIAKLTDFFTDDTLKIDGFFDHPTLKQLHIEPKKTKKLGIMDKIQAILEMIASNGQNSGCFFV